MGIWKQFRTNIGTRRARKAEQARHRVDDVVAVVASIEKKDPVPTSIVLYKHTRTIKDLRTFIRQLKEDHIVLERGAMTCAYNREFTLVSRFNGDTVTVSSYCEAEPHLREIAKKIRIFESSVNALDSHPDFMTVRRSKKALARSERKAPAQSAA